MRVWLLAATAALLAQTQPPIRVERPFESGIEITSITATVTDAEGHLITGLPQEAFEVFEDGERQTITQFTKERVPIGLGVLLDISDSMFGKRIQDARAAVDRFLFELLDPTDEFFLLVFNHRPRALTGWTRSQAEVQRVLATLKPSGGTAMYDAIVDSLPLIDNRSRARAALLVISDGADTASNASLRDLRMALLRSDVFVYAIAIDSPERRAINTSVNAQALREVTADSGGRTEIVHSSADLDEATARIAEELNSQYVLGYSSSHGADGQYHSIRVRAAKRDEAPAIPVTPGIQDAQAAHRVPVVQYRVRSRNGYVATPLAGRKRR